MSVRGSTLANRPGAGGDRDSASPPTRERVENAGLARGATRASPRRASASLVAAHLAQRPLPGLPPLTWLDVFEAAARAEGALTSDVLAGARSRTPTRARRLALAVLMSRGYSCCEIASVVRCTPSAVLTARAWAARCRPSLVDLGGAVPDAEEKVGGKGVTR
jgi:hypothetical protein